MAFFEKSKEELLKRHAQELEEFNRRQVIESRLPLPPEYVHLFEPVIWVTYEARSMGEALNIVRRYYAETDIQQAQAISDGGVTSVAPPNSHPERYRGKEPKWIVEQCVCISQHGGHGFHHNEVSFWVERKVDGQPRMMKICIRLDGFRWEYQSQMSFRLDAFGNVVSSSFIRHDPPIPADESIKFSTGSNNSFRLNYYYELHRFADMVEREQKKRGEAVAHAN